MSDRFFVPLVLGHNAFFGVDHLSAARGQQREAQFAEPGRILSVIEAATEAGAGGLMMSTHERAGPVAELLAGCSLRERLQFYPLLPYVQKYVTAANEKGILHVIMDSLSGATTGERLGMIWNGAKGLVGKDARSLLSALIRMELQRFRKLSMPCVFLHDVFTDLALALDLRGIVEFFHEEMQQKYGCRAAFATKNLPLFLEKLHAWGYSDPLVMPHFNKVGYCMNPSREACEAALRARPARVMAMSTLASGYLAPDEAYAYLAAIPRIESVVVGVSSPEHIATTFAAIRRHLGAS